MRIALLSLLSCVAFLAEAQDSIAPAEPTPTWGKWYMGGHFTLGSSFRFLGYEGDDPQVREEFLHRKNNELPSFGRAFGMVTKYRFAPNFFAEFGMNYRVESYQYETEFIQGSSSDSLPDFLLETDVVHTTLEMPLAISMIAGKLPRLKFSQSLGVNLGYIAQRRMDTLAQYRYLGPDDLVELQNSSEYVDPDQRFRLVPTYGIGLQFIYRERFHFLWEATIAMDALAVMRGPVTEHLFSWGGRFGFFVALPSGSKPY